MIMGGIMSEEKREILQMLKEGVISVDDAERLLNALHERSEDHGQTNSHESKTKESTIKTVFSCIEEGLSGIGPMIKETIQNVVGDGNDEIPAGFEKIILKENELELDEGSDLSIYSKKRAKGDVKLHGVPGRLCELISENDDTEVYKNGNSVIIKYSGDGFRASIPKSVSSLKVKIMGGNIDYDDIHCAASIKTMGGNIRVSGVESDTNIKTMGGNIGVILSDDWKKEFSATTMGGSIVIRLPKNISSKISSSTMAGDIYIDSGFSLSNNNKGFPFQKLKGSIGDHDSDNSIKLKTMAGNIDIKGKG